MTRCVGPTNDLNHKVTAKKHANVVIPDNIGCAEALFSPLYNCSGEAGSDAGIPRTQGEEVERDSDRQTNRGE